MPVFYYFPRILQAYQSGNLDWKRASSFPTHSLLKNAAINLIES